MNIPRKLLYTTLLAIPLFLAACGSSLQATSWPGVTVDSDTAYVANQNHIYAVDVTTGAEKWRFPRETERNLTFFARPALAPDGQLIVGDYNNNLHSLDPETGQEQVLGNWPYDQATNRYIGGPLAMEAGIFAPSSDGRLYALDFQGNPIWDNPFQTSQPQWARPVSDGRQLYLPSLDHSVYAVNLETGQQVWSQDLSGAIVGTPALSEDGILYVGTFGKELVALRADGGDVLWRVDTEGWVWSGPALDGDQLYFGDLNGFLYAVNRQDGSIVWRQQADGMIAGTPLVTEEALYFATETGNLVSVNKDGSPRWSQTVEGKLYTSPIAAGDLILVAASESPAVLLAFNPSGSPSWAFAPES